MKPVAFPTGVLEEFLKNSNAVFIIILAKSWKKLPITTSKSKGKKLVHFIQLHCPLNIKAIINYLQQAIFY